MTQTTPEARDRPRPFAFATGVILVVVLGLVATAHAQTQPNTDVGGTGSVGNSNEGSGSAGGGSSQPKPTPRPPAPVITPRATAAPTFAPPAATPRVTRPAPRATPKRTVDSAAAKARREAQEAARREARRDQGIREEILQFTPCVAANLGPGERAVLLLRAHPSGGAARSRGEVAKLLATSTVKLAGVEGRGLKRVRMLRREGLCAPRPVGEVRREATQLELTVLNTGKAKPAAKPPAKPKPKPVSPASSVDAQPAAAASADWTKQALVFLQIFVLLAAATWVARAVWRVL